MSFYAYILQDRAKSLTLQANLTYTSAVPSGTLTFYSIDGSPSTSWNPPVAALSITNAYGENALNVGTFIDQNTRDASGNSIFANAGSLTATYSVGGVTVSTIGSYYSYSLLSAASAFPAGGSWSVIPDVDGQSIWAASANTGAFQKYNIISKTFTRGFFWPFDSGEPITNALSTNTAVFFEDTAGHLYAMSGGLSPSYLMRLHKLDQTTFAELGAIGYDGQNPPGGALPQSNAIFWPVDWCVFTQGGVDYAAFASDDFFSNIGYGHVVRLSTMTIVGSYAFNNFTQEIPTAVWYDGTSVWWATTSEDNDNLNLYKWTSGTSGVASPDSLDPQLNVTQPSYNFIAGNMWQSIPAENQNAYVMYDSGTGHIIVGNSLPSYYIPGSVTSGTFQSGEIVQQSNTGATTTLIGNGPVGSSSMIVNGTVTESNEITGSVLLQTYITGNAQNPTNYATGTVTATPTYIQGFGYTGWSSPTAITQNVTGATATTAGYTATNNLLITGLTGSPDSFDTWTDGTHNYFPFAVPQTGFLSGEQVKQTAPGNPVWGTIYGPNNYPSGSQILFLFTGSGSPNATGVWTGQQSGTQYTPTSFNASTSFMVSETLQQANSGATATIAGIYQFGALMYLTSLAGSPTSSDLWYGTTSFDAFVPYIAPTTPTGFTLGEYVTQNVTGASAQTANTPTGSNPLFVGTVSGSPDATDVWIGGTSYAQYVPTSVPTLVPPNGTDTWVGQSSAAVFTPTGVPAIGPSVGNTGDLGVFNLTTGAQVTFKPASLNPTLFSGGVAFAQDVAWSAFRASKVPGLSNPHLGIPGDIPDPGAPTAPNLVQFNVSSVVVNNPGPGNASYSISTTSDVTAGNDIYVFANISPYAALNATDNQGNVYGRVVSMRDELTEQVGFHTTASQTGPLTAEIELFAPSTNACSGAIVEVSGSYGVDAFSITGNNSIGGTNNFTTSITTNNANDLIIVFTSQNTTLGTGIINYTPTVPFTINGSSYVDTYGYDASSVLMSYTAPTATTYNPTVMSSVTPSVGYRMSAIALSGAPPSQRGGVLNVVDETSLSVVDSYNLTQLAVTTLTSNPGYPEEGLWNPAAAYDAGDIVRYNGAVYIAVAPNGSYPITAVSVPQFPGQVTGSATGLGSFDYGGSLSGDLVTQAVTNVTAILTGVGSFPTDLWSAWTIPGTTTSGYLHRAEQIVQAVTGAKGSAFIAATYTMTGAATVALNNPELEVLTQAVSGATAQYITEGKNGTLYLVNVTGTPDATDVWNGNYGGQWTPTSAPTATTFIYVYDITGAPDGVNTWTGQSFGGVFTPTGTPTLLTSGTADGTDDWVGQTSTGVYTPTSTPSPFRLLFTGSFLPPPSFGQTLNVSGFVNSGNNGSFSVTYASQTTALVFNPTPGSGVPETHPATGYISVPQPPSISTDNLWSEVPAFGQTLDDNDPRSPAIPPSAALYFNEIEGIFVTTPQYYGGPLLYFEPPPTPPTVTGCTPPTGTTAGGTAITNLAGTNFVTGATVTFDGIPATSVVWVSSTQLTCLTPAHAAGTVDIVVTNPDTLFGTLHNGYTYITGVQPTAVAISSNVNPSLFTFPVTFTVDVTAAVFVGTTFNGTSNMVTTTNSSMWGNGHAVSVEFGFKTTSTIGGHFVIASTDQYPNTVAPRNGVDAEPYFSVYINGAGNIGVEFYNGSLRLFSSLTPATYNDGGLHQCVVTIGSNTVIIYIDGTAVVTETLTTGIPSVTNVWWRIANGPDVYGGSWPAQATFFSALNASMYDVAVWDSTVLTSTQVTTHFTAFGMSQPAYETVVAADSPTSYWHLREDLTTLVAADSVGSNPGTYYQFITTSPFYYTLGGSFIGQINSTGSYPTFTGANSETGREYIRVGDSIFVQMSVDPEASGTATIVSLTDNYGNTYSRAGVSGGFNDGFGGRFITIDTWWCQSVVEIAPQSTFIPVLTVSSTSGNAYPNPWFAWSIPNVIGVDQSAANAGTISVGGTWTSPTIVISTPEIILATGSSETSSGTTSTQYQTLVYVSGGSGVFTGIYFNQSLSGGSYQTAWTGVAGNTYGTTMTSFTIPFGRAVAGSGAPTPTGAVNLFDGATLIAAALPLTAGQTQFTTFGLNTGTHTITANYVPDSGSFDPSTGFMTQVVSPLSGAWTNGPFINRVALYGLPLLVPYSQPSLGGFDPRRDLQIYVNGQLMTVTNFTVDVTNDRYLIYTSKTFDLQGIIQVVHLLPSPPFLDSSISPQTVKSFALIANYSSVGV